MNGNRPSVALVAHGVHFQGGMERALAELVRRASDRYRFVVFSAELAPELRPLVDWRRIRVPMRPIPLKEVTFALVAGLRLARARVDLVHTMGALVPNRCDLAGAHFCVAGFREKTGGLAPPNGTPLRRLNTSIARRIGLFLERWCYRPGRVRLLGSVSRGLAAELAAHYPGVEIELTPNGAELERFRPDPVGRAALRRAEGVGDDEVVALFVAGGWDHKGLAYAIEGLAEARRLGERRLRLWVVGRGPEERYRELAAGVGVAERVTFFGPRKDVARFYRAADLFVLPTLYEAGSVVSYEATAAGLPLVATPVNAIEEHLEAGAGIAVRRDAVDVGAALARLAGDPELRRRMGAAGRKVADGYTWSRSVETVVAVYDKLRAEETC